MSEFIAIVQENELEGGAMRAVEMDGTTVLVRRLEDGEVCAIANTCAHMGDLERGRARGGQSHLSLTRLAVRLVQRGGSGTTGH